MIAERTSTEMKYDNLLKTIFYDSMPAFVRMLGCAAAAEFLTVEFPVRSKLGEDAVVRLVDGKILHLEFQLTNDPRMHWHSTTTERSRSSGRTPG